MRRNLARVSEVQFDSLIDVSFGEMKSAVKLFLGRALEVSSTSGCKIALGLGAADPGNGRCM